MSATTEAFRVDTWSHLLGALVTRHRRTWIRLGNLETRLLADDLAQTDVVAPIYIAGLARSGSTLLLEILNRHPQVTTHRYQDYPMLFTPYLWQRFLDRVPRSRAPAVERAHGDGIRVTPESPEAFEEMLWMAFFPGLHDPQHSAVLGTETANPEFEAFYQAHIRKLLLARAGARYLSKGNYNVTRLDYLLKQFPDARFILPVRDPVWHIASLMKQHRLFCKGQQAHPRAVSHLRRVGHFEFGTDRRPINAGPPGDVQKVLELWHKGAEVEGWAHYWSHIHHHLADRLEHNDALRRATMIIRFEDMCYSPAPTLRNLLGHCHLAAPEGMVEREAAAIRFPDYYQPEFTAAEMDTIRRITTTAATRIGLFSSRDRLQSN